MPIITRELNVLARCGVQFRNLHLTGLDITATQAPYILRVSAQPGLSQEELARALHVNPSNAARQLALLEKSEYVRREAGADDKRVLAVYPTAKALAACPEIRRVNALWQDYITRDISAEDKVLLVTLLEKMRLRAIGWVAGGDEV